MFLLNNPHIYDITTTSGSSYIGFPCMQMHHKNNQCLQKGGRNSDSDVDADWFDNNDIKPALRVFERGSVVIVPVDENWSDSLYFIVAVSYTHLPLGPGPSIFLVHRAWILINIFSPHGAHHPMASFHTFAVSSQPWKQNVF